MSRRVFPALTVLSLLLFIAAVAADVRSRNTTFGWAEDHTLFYADEFGKPVGGPPGMRQRNLIASGGVFYYLTYGYRDGRSYGKKLYDDRRPLTTRDLSGIYREGTWHGFSWRGTYSRSPNASGYMTQRSVPLWMVAAAAAVLPVRWLVLFRRRRRPPGSCATCGYNLTGNTSGVCPECGTPTTAGVKA
jgi:hypothetical protein